MARAQIFDAAVPGPSVYEGRVDFVWGARIEKQHQWLPEISHGYYWPAFRDHSHPLAWYQSSHPDWLVYQQDRTTIAFPTSDHSYVPVDVSNDAVRRYFWAQNIQPGIDAGYDVICLDNLLPINTFGYAGVYTRRGEWVQQYTGEFDDPAFSSMVLDWISWLTERIHRAGLLVAGNMWWSSRSYPPEIEILRESARIMDIYVDETGFTRLGNPVVYLDDKWQRKINFIADVARTKFVVLINKTTTDHLADTPDAYQEWVLANYFLVWSPRLLLSMCGKREYSTFVDSPWLNLDPGTPLDDRFSDRGGVQVREFTAGISLVNPWSSGDLAFTLPPGSWRSAAGEPITGEVVLGPGTGRVVLRS